MTRAKGYSGRFVLRLAPVLHARLVEHADAIGLSLNCACTRLLEVALSERMSVSLPFELGALVAPECLLANDVLGLVMYGSQARGDSTADSDVDILVVVADSRPITRSLYAELDTTLAPDRKVSLMLSHLPGTLSRPGSLWLEASQDGRILYDRDEAVHRTLVAIRRLIASGRVMRRESHGQGYWIHAE